MIYVALPVCDISPLIEKVLECLFTNTDSDFMLSVWDNDSYDDTCSKIDETVHRLDTFYPGKMKKMVMTYGNNNEYSNRRPSIDCINGSLQPFTKENPDDYNLVVKLDHDYGVPKGWDTDILNVFKYRPDLRLLSPSVRPETPKGMQYYSQNIPPDSVSYLTEENFSYTLYHYVGIAGYCHCFRPQDYLRTGWPYQSLNRGAVFGSEDAERSLRMGGGAYLFESQGWHWDKPEIGSYESTWKGEATFLKTGLQFNEWAKTNVPAELQHLVTRRKEDAD